MSRGRKITSKYEGRCGHCGSRYGVGQTIVDSGEQRDNGKRKWVCEPCFAKQEMADFSNTDPFADFTNQGDSDMTKQQFEQLNATDQRRAVAEIMKDTELSATALRKLSRIERVALFEAYKDQGIEAAVEVAKKVLDRFDDETPAAKPAPASTGDNKLDALKELLGLNTVEIDMDQIREMVREEVLNAKRTIEIKHEDGPTIDVGRQHYLFEKILKLVQRRHNVMLVGPAGSGKTTVCQNVAKALELSFEFTAVSSQTTKTDLIGYNDANSKYVPTALRRMYEHGGVFLLDEVDAGNPNVMTTVNALLENGHGAFPDGMIERHKDFICIVAGNTYGRGADRMYVGRNQLDAATLDRFFVVDFDYDEDLELDIALQYADSNQDVIRKWVRNIQALRHAAFDLKERVVISPRASIKGADLLTAGFTKQECLDGLVWKSIPADIQEKITAHAA